jgi:hypothetical protein
VAPIEGGERRRRPSGVQSLVEEVAGGARWRSGVQRKERPRVGRAGLEWATNWAGFEKFQRKSRRAAKATELN